MSQRLNISKGEAVAIGVLWAFIIFVLLPKACTVEAQNEQRRNEGYAYISASDQIVIDSKGD